MLRLQEKKEYANNLMKIVDEIHHVDGDEVDAGVDGDPRINSSLSSEDFNTPLAKRLVNKLRKEKRQHMRKNGVLTTDTAASESEISMRAERDENDISGVENIETVTKPTLATIEPSTSSPMSARASTLGSIGMKRRLLIDDDDDDDADDDTDDESVSDLKQEKVKPRSGHA